MKLSYILFSARIVVTFQNLLSGQNKEKLDVVS
ncbi:hypothetical protein [Clostridioides difficile]